MVLAFAEPSDVEAIWRPLAIAESEAAEKLLGYASNMIRVRYPNIDANLASGAVTALTLEQVVVGMVKRAMLASDAAGLASLAQAAGPFSQNATFTNPSGNLYLSADDLKLLDGEGSAPRAHVGWLA